MSRTVRFKNMRPGVLDLTPLTDVKGQKIAMRPGAVVECLESDCDTHSAFLEKMLDAKPPWITVVGSEPVPTPVPAPKPEKPVIKPAPEVVPPVTPAPAPAPAAQTEPPVVHPAETVVATETVTVKETPVDPKANKSSKNKG